MGANLPAVVDDRSMVVIPGQADRFMPVMSMQHAVQRYNALLEFTKQIMKEGKDYGKVPGVEKPSLLKPGAEKLCNFFGLTPTFEIVDKTEIWEGDEPFFYYWYKAKLWRGQDLIGEGDGSCNSRESKYRYRWVGEQQIPEHLDKKRLATRGGRVSEFEFAIDKAETSGKFGKPAAYWQAFKDAIANGTATLIQKPLKSGELRPAWEIDSTMYRVPNPDVCDQVNTIQKMAQKRALVAATLIACNASEYYTQDIEDMDVIDVTPIPQHLTTPIANQGPVNGETRGQKPEEARNDVKSQTGPAMAQKNPTPIQAPGAVTPEAPNAGSGGGSASASPAHDGVPAEVQALWNRMGSKKGQIQDVLAEMLSELVELCGVERGNDEFKRIEIVYAGSPGGAIAKVGFARRVVLEMWKRIQEIKAEQSAVKQSDVLFENEPAEALYGD